MKTIFATNTAPCLPFASPAETATAEVWADFGFDDFAWDNAVEHSEAAVSPKDGYDRIDWERSTALIWDPDLGRDNKLACRLPVVEQGGGRGQ